MAQFLQIHPDNPQQRLIEQAADIVRRGGIMAYPTDSAYALGCHLGDRAALDRIRHMRQLDKHHNFTLMCRDLSELATYARVDRKSVVEGKGGPERGGRGGGIGQAERSDGRRE